MPEQLKKLIGGVHPHGRKELSSAAAIQTAPLLDSYTVPLHQHIGAPPTVLVEKKETVLRGQKIAEAGGFVSAPVHAPTSGTVTAIGECLSPAGTKVPAVEIAADGEDTPDESLPPLPDWEQADPETLKDRVRQAGIVGMGGAAFPTHVKLSPPPAKPVDVLILNGVECEPYLTADERLMLEAPERILTGARIFARILGIDRILLGIENNKPEAIELMRSRAKEFDVGVVPLHVRYPQGAEKQLIYALTGRSVPAGGLPMDIGAVVQNVATCAAACDAVLEGKPLYERVTTVTGALVAQPGNWRLRVGTPIQQALTWAGGVIEDPAKLIVGGPMMGMSVYSLDIPLVKSSSGVLLLGRDEIAQFTSQPCIRCGRCVDACPMNLLPGTLSVLVENEDFEEAEALRAMDCIECGCCAYACPASRPLVQHFKRAKAEIAGRRRAKQESA